MIKYICNICNAETDQRTFEFPCWVDEQNWGEIVRPKIKLDITNVHLCTECRKVLADMIYYNDN